MRKKQRFIVSFNGVYMEKSITGTETRKYPVEIRDHFAPNLELAKRWAEQNILKYLPKGIEWITYHSTVVPDDFEKRRRGIRVPIALLKRFLDESYLKYQPLMLGGFAKGFHSDEDRWNKQSKFYLDLFETDFNIKPDCVEEYHIVFWNKLQNHIIRFLKHQEFLASHQEKQEDAVEASESMSAAR